MICVNMKKILQVGVKTILKIAIVDDEKECLNEIGRFCSDFGANFAYSVETVLFASGEAFLEAFESGGFSVVFMDIYMDGMDGIAAALKMRSMDSRCLLVFLTSSVEFMPDAFSCHAFEYITKPFSRQRIFDVLSDAAKVLPHSKRYIKLVNGREAVRVPLDEIISVVTDAHYLDVTLANGKNLRCRMTMAEFEEKTGRDARFILVNRGIYVNAEYILTFEDRCCVMENGTKFPVRVRDSARIEQAVLDYNFQNIRSQQRNRRGDF